MPQNIYDDDAFHQGYSALPRSLHGLDGAPEWLAVRSLLPELEGRRVVDLGCGFGWFARWAAAEGASEVLALDVSEKMLRRADRDTASAAVRYELADLERIDLHGSDFDLAYSSLAFHYVADFPRLASAIAAALKPGSSLIFTIEHPIFMASADARWHETDAGEPYWPVDRYFLEGRRSTSWFVDGVIKYHRTLSTTLMALLDAGFVIDHVEEWRPADDQLQQHPQWAIELHRPMFLIVKATRRA